MTDPHIDFREFRRRVAFTLGLATLIAAALFVFWHAPDIFLLTFFAVLIGVLLQTLASFVARSGLPYRAALALVGVLILALFAGIGFLAGPTLTQQLGNIADEIPRTMTRLESFLGNYGWGRELLQRVPLLEQGPDAGAGAGAADGAGPTGTAGTADTGASGAGGVESVGGGLASQLTSIVSGMVSLFGHMFFVVLTGIFLAAAPQLYRRGVTAMFPARHQPRADEVLHDVHGALRGWLLGQLIAMVFVGTGVAVGLLILGVPFALGLGFIAFLFEFVPTIGPWIAGVPAVLIALTVSPTTALWVAGLFLLVEMLEGNLVLPLVYQHTVELPPALTMFSIFLMGALFGFVGVLVAAPLAAVALVLVRDLYLSRVSPATHGT